MSPKFTVKPSKFYLKYLGDSVACKVHGVGSFVHGQEREVSEQVYKDYERDIRVRKAEKREQKWAVRSE